VLSYSERGRSALPLDHHMMRGRNIAGSLVAMLTLSAMSHAFADPQPTSRTPETQGVPTGASLSRDSVVTLANAEASRRGYVLSNYLSPRVYDQFLKADRTWTVFYEGKDMALGNQFIVHIDDQTNALELLPGE
jgi:hypothetical protein